MVTGRSGKATDGAQSIRRASAVLRAVATGQSSGIGLHEIAESTGLARPTVHRMLRTLVAEGLIEQNPRTRRYAIGEQVSMLALARSKRSALLAASDVFIDRIAQEVGDTVFLTTRTGDDTLCLGRRMGGYPIQVLVIEVGARRPLGVSAAGVAILSCLPVDEADRLLERNAHRLAGYRMTVEGVRGRIEDARRRGYALSDPGLVPGTKALAVPILGNDGMPVGALTINAVRQRMRPQREGEIRDLIAGYSSRIAEQLAALK